MKYTKTHEWVKAEGTKATVGITDKAQKEIGEIVYVELPVVGNKVKAGDEGIVLESTKAAVDLYFPVSGEIIEVNTALHENPELINKSAEKEGWLYKINMQDTKELDKLLDVKE